MPEPIMKKASGDGIKIQLALWGKKGKPILCLHGITANCRCWDYLASTLSPHHRIMAMDLRGRGLSDKPPTGYSIDHHCQDILAVLNDLGCGTSGAYGSFPGGLHFACFCRPKS